MRRTLRQNAAAAMLLDASKHETFVILFATSVSQLTVKNISPGQLYCFVLIQDSKGEHTLNWGNKARNGTLLNPTPESLTVQNFIGMANDILRATLPGTWNK